MLTWKLNEAISPKIWIKSKQSMTFLIVFHLKPIPLLYLVKKSFVSTQSTQTADLKILNFQ